MAEMGIKKPNTLEMLRLNPYKLGFELEYIKIGNLMVFNQHKWKFQQPDIRLKMT